MRIGGRLLPVLGLALILSGCAGLRWPDQPETTGSEQLNLSAQQTVGQSFVAREAGLAGIEVFLSPASAQTEASGEIRLHLRADPAAEADLAVASLPLTAVNHADYYRFAFAAQPNSHRHGYYAWLEVVGSGGLALATGPGAAYLEGAAYQQDEPVDGQLAFRLVYAPAQVLLGLVAELGQWLVWLVVAALLFIVPGLALLKWLWPESRGLSLGERLGLGAGVSLAVYPLLFLWTDVVHVHLGALYAWLPAAAGLAGLAWPRAPAHAWQPMRSLQAWWSSDCRWPDLAMLALTGLVVLTRWWGGRQLDLPLWGDSIDHSLIAQLLVDHSGLFQSWAPYNDLRTFTYHFGFHSSVAAFHWLSGLAIPQAVLWAGQVLNVLAVLALYPLGVKIGGNRWAGVAAVLMAGLLSSMPMFYTNWGRYTQLAGQVLLPVAMILTWAAINGRSRARGLLALAVVVVAGLALTHYRVLLLYALFVAALLLVNGRQARSALRPVLWLAVGSGLLFLPWFINAFGSRLLAALASLLKQAPPPAGQLGEAADFAGAGLFYSSWFLALAALGLLGGLWRRPRQTLLVMLWSVLVLLAANPNWLRLPGASVLGNFAMIVAAYIPAALLTAAAAAWMATPGARRWEPALLVGVLALGVWGARQRSFDVKASIYALASGPDQRAADWIATNLPPEARLLINSFFAYGGTVVVGSDGGWWLPVLARRQVSVPSLKYAVEQGDRPDYVAWINGLTAAIGSAGLDDPHVQALLTEHGITHVYIGQQQGRVNYSGPDILRPQVLLASPLFRAVYHRDRVWVFELVP